MKKALFMSSLMATCSLFAADEMLKEILVSTEAPPSSQSIKSLIDESKSLSIINEQSIQKSVGKNVLELIAQEPGVGMVNDGMDSGQPVIRGMSAGDYRVPTFIDGLRWKGRPVLEYTMFDPDQFERLEIVRGPASSVFGTDSFGGVINLVSKRASGDVFGDFALSDNYFSSNFSSVNHGMQNRLQLGFVGHGFDFLLGLNYRYGRDYKTPEGKVPNSDYLYKSFDLNTGYSWGDSHRIGLQARYGTTKRGMPGGSVPSPGAGNTAKGVPNKIVRQMPLWEKYAALNYNGEIFENFELDANVFAREIYTNLYIVPDLSKNAFVNNYVVGPEVLGSKIVAKYKGEHLTQTYGINIYHEIWDSTQQSIRGGARKNTSIDHTQLNLAGFGLFEYRFDNEALLSASLRYDHFKSDSDISSVDESLKSLYQDGGVKTKKLTWAIGTSYPIMDSIKLIANISSAFRNPTANEIEPIASLDGTTMSIPNNNLKPEQSINYELGLKFQNDYLRASITSFYSDYKDLIQDNVRVADYLGMKTYQNQNLDKASIKGVEFELAYNILNNLELSTNVSYQRGKDKENNKNLRTIMPLHGMVGLNYEPEILNNSYLQYTSAWAMRKNKIDESQERQKAGYVVHNIYFGKSFGKIASFENFELNFAVENIFDKKYRVALSWEDRDYPVSITNPLLNAGRNFKVGFKASF